MSRWEKQHIVCPRCGTVQEAKVFVSVNGARIKDAADRLIDGRWGEVSCLRCGICSPHDAPLLFSDIPGGWWIVQYDASERGRSGALEEEADAIFQREFLERPPAVIRNQARSVERRICFGRRQLAEKLRLRRHGLDDRVMECMKIVLMRDYLRELYRFGPTEFLVEEVDADVIRLSATPIDEANPVLNLRIGRQTWRAIADDAERFYGSYPELFTKLYVSASRYVTFEEGGPVRS